MGTRNQDVIVDYVVGMADRGGGTATDLAWRLGISRARANALLLDLPAAQGFSRPKTTAHGATLWLPAQPVSAAEAERARMRLARLSRQFRGARIHGVPTRKEELLLAAQRLLAAVRDGDFCLAGALAADQRLDAAAARRMVPPDVRDEVSAVVLHARADAAMQSGAHELAARLCRRGLRYAREPALRSTLWAIHGACMRMAGGACVTCSLESYEQAAVESRPLPPQVLRFRLRNIHASAVAPLLALGDDVRAERSVEASLDVAGDDDPAWPETVIREAQVNLARGSLDAASRTLERLPPCSEMPHFLRGWEAKIRVDLLARTSKDPGDWNDAMLHAWMLCRGYGFQVRLLCARIAAHPQLFLPDVWPDEPLREMRRRLSAFHIERWGTWYSKCPTCSAASLPEVAAHALGISLGRLPRELST